GRRVIRVRRGGRYAGSDVRSHFRGSRGGLSERQVARSVESSPRPGRQIEVPILVIGHRRHATIVELHRQPHIAPLASARRYPTVAVVHVISALSTGKWKDEIAL